MREESPGLHHGTSMMGDPQANVDEPGDELGSSLALPPWTEAAREIVESQRSAGEFPDQRNGADDAGTDDAGAPTDRGGE